MEENKNLNPENNEEILEATEEVKQTAAEPKNKKKFKLKLPKSKKQKLIKNQALFKRGGYSLVITAAVLAGIVVLNVLLSVLADRFVLEFDMSSEKTNSISEENAEYIKNLDTEVNVTVCALANDYVGDYMTYYAQQYGVSENYTDYYKQTISLIDKYDNYNDKINIRYIDTQDTEFTEISTKYSNEKINYGDIIVTATVNGNERYKIVGYEDIYNLTEDETYAAYGYSMSTVSGNNIETALTSAIAYVTSTETKKVAFLTGHSKTDYTEDYRSLLKTNNYEVDVISDIMVNEISNEYDAVFIVAPTTDFKESELDAIAKFLDNDDKYEKGLVFFADPTAPYLTNLYSFLEQWGISVGEGILFETDSNYHGVDEPTLMISVATGEDDVTGSMQYAITGYNAPLSAAFETEGSVTVKKLFATSESVVNAPVGTSNDWKGADDYTKASFPTVLKATRSTYDDDNNLIENNVYAFASFEFIYSAYNEYSDVANKNMSFAAAESAVNAEDTGIDFIAKTITNESFSDSVTEDVSNTINVIFMFILPIACIVAGIYVYIRRKNS